MHCISLLILCTIPYWILWSCFPVRILCIWCWNTNKGGAAAKHATKPAQSARNRLHHVTVAFIYGYLCLGTWEVYGALLCNSPVAKSARPKYIFTLQTASPLTAIMLPVQLTYFGSVRVLTVPWFTYGKYWEVANHIDLSRVSKGGEGEAFKIQMVSSNILISKSFGEHFRKLTFEDS